MDFKRVFALIIFACVGLEVFGQPNAPTVSGTTPTNDQTPTWSWTSGGDGNGYYRYGYSEGSWIEEDIEITSFTPASDLAEGDRTLYVQESDGTLWSTSGSHTIAIDITDPASPTISGISAGVYNTDQTFTVSGETNATLDYSTDDGTTWIGYTTSVTLSAEGTYEIYARQTDEAGNGPVATATAITVEIDKTDPASPTISGISAGVYNTDQTFTVSGETNATLDYSTDGGTTWIGYTTSVTLSAEGTYEIYARQTDEAGNGPVATATAITVEIDKTDPASPTISGISAGVYNTDQTFTVSGETNATLDYSTDGGTTWIGYTTSVTLSAEGTYEIYARQTDEAGNGPVATATAIAVEIDKTDPASPTISGISAGVYNTDQTFTVSGETNATLDYSTDGGTTWIGYTTSVTLSAEGTYEIYARQTDEAGNGPVATATAIAVEIDKTDPASPTISGISAGVYNTDQTFTVSGETNATLDYSTDGGTTWIGYTTSVTLSAEGTYEIYARQTDEAGNGPVATATAITVEIDKTTQIPVLTSPATDGADDVNLSINFQLPEAALSGSVKMIFTNTGGGNDTNDPHEITFNSNFEFAGTHSTNLNGSDLSANANVASVDSKNGNDFFNGWSGVHG
jgi:large repetitive protein